MSCLLLNQHVLVTSVLQLVTGLMEWVLSNYLSSGFKVLEAGKYTGTRLSNW